MVNKWDLIEKETDTSKKFTQQIKQKIAPFTDVPIIFTSVKEKQRIFKALETAIYVFENRKKRIPTAKLNEVMLQAIQDVPPPATKGKYIRIKYATQLPGRTPALLFSVIFLNMLKNPIRGIWKIKSEQTLTLQVFPSAFLCEKNNLFLFAGQQ